MRADEHVHPAREQPCHDRAKWWWAAGKPGKDERNAGIWGKRYIPYTGGPQVAPVIADWTSDDVGQLQDAAARDG